MRGGVLVHPQEEEEEEEDEERGRQRAENLGFKKV
jgi:hypothetical protein